MAIYSLPTYESYEVDMLLDESYDMLYELEDEQCLYESNYIIESGFFRTIVDKIKEIWHKIVETVKKWAEKIKKFFGFDSDEAKAAEDLENKTEKAAEQGEKDANAAAKSGDIKMLNAGVEKANDAKNEIDKKMEKISPTKGGNNPIPMGGGTPPTKGGNNPIPTIPFPGDRRFVAGEKLVPRGGGELVPRGGRELVPRGGGELVPRGGRELVPRGGGEHVPRGGRRSVSGGGYETPNLREMVIVYKNPTDIRTRRDVHRFFRNNGIDAHIFSEDEWKKPSIKRPYAHLRRLTVNNLDDVFKYFEGTLPY